MFSLWELVLEKGGFGGFLFVVRLTGILGKVEGERGCATAGRRPLPFFLLVLCMTLCSTPLQVLPQQKKVCAAPARSRTADGPQG